jgi:glycosyltransferase involved in cell wall biosynthesis
MLSRRIVRIIHLSYAVPVPQYAHPEKWLARISFITGVFESEAKYAKVTAIYHINHRGTAQQNNVTYHFTKLKRWQLLFPFSFHRFIKKLKPDVIIVHGFIFPMQVLLLRLKLGAHIKIILRHHADRPFRDFRQYLQRWADRYVSAYLFASCDLGQPWTEHKQIRDRSKIKGIMGTSSNFYPMKKDLARQFTNVGSGRIFLWVGDLSENKDPLLVVKAFAEFIKTDTTARLYMVYQTAGLLENLKAEVVNLSVSDSVYLVGKVENKLLVNWYSSADFILSSSHYESGGIAVCEGMSCGCIPIVTDIPSFRMMTDDGRVGLQYPAGDAEALLAALKKSLAIDVEEEKVKVLAQFHKQLSFDAIARKTMDVIKNLT